VQHLCIGIASVRPSVCMSLSSRLSNFDPCLRRRGGQEISIDCGSRRRRTADASSECRVVSRHRMLNADLFSPIQYLPRDAMLARYLLSSCVRPSVRPSVCPSQAGRPIVPKRLDEYRAGFRCEGFLPSIPDSVVRTFGYLQNTVLFSGTLS